MIELEFYIKKLQDLEGVGEWKEVYLPVYQKVHPIIYESHFLRRNYYLKELEKYHHELMDLSFSLSASEKLKFRKHQKHIIDLLYQVQEENKKIFIAHGNDSVMIDKVTSFLGKLRLSYVLIEDPLLDRNVKTFKQLVKECGYAIVLFSAEELGRELTGQQNEKVRASQKVIFQTGFFVAHAGRKNIFILHSEDKEIDSPFDFEGLAYTAFDAKGNWKSVLVNQMEASGIYIEKSLINS